MLLAHALVSADDGVLIPVCASAVSCFPSVVSIESSLPSASMMDSCDSGRCVEPPLLRAVAATL